MSAPLRIEVAPGVFRAENRAPSPSEYDDTVETHLRHLDTGDLIEALAEAEGSVAAAVASGDPTTVGAVVLAVRQAYACQLADIKLYGPQNVRSPSLEEAACAALLARAADKAGPRRFSGEAVTGFGGLSA